MIDEESLFDEHLSLLLLDFFLAHYSGESDDQMLLLLSEDVVL